MRTPFMDDSSLLFRSSPIFSLLCSFKVSIPLAVAAAYTSLVVDAPEQRASYLSLALSPLYPPY